MKLSEMDLGERFRFVNRLDGFSKDDVFIFCGTTDVFVYGPNVFDVCLEHKEEDFFSVENQEVVMC